MAVSYIKIENYKSIKDIFLKISDINTLIGENGSGKSNILSAMKFFYSKLNEQSSISPIDIFDINNKYSNEVKITIGYNLKKLKRMCYKNNINVAENKFYNDIVHLSETDEIEVTMIAIKDRDIIWNKNYQQRQLLYYLYPIYTIDTRKINLSEWNKLWNQIGNLGKLEKNAEIKFKEEINNNIKDDKKLRSLYCRISQVLEKNNIKIKKYTPGQMAEITSKLYFGGEIFEVDEQKLNIYSNGTNTYNYLKSYVQILALLSDIKMKEPMLIIDEPEISLHHNFIDEVVRILFENSKRIKIIISTHSSRLIKNVLIENIDESVIYHIKKHELYTTAKRMRRFQDTREYVRVTDQHANAYFAKMIVCVEGATEVELLRNRFLKLVYPVLNEIDVMEGMAEEVERKIISPKERKYDVPIIYTIDMDKVLIYSKEKKCLQIRKGKLNFNPNYSFTYKRYNTIAVKKRINNMVEKCAFRYKMPIFTCVDKNFLELKSLIKKYFLEYDYFVMDTTIEGMLINIFNLDKFILFIKENCRKNISWERIEKIVNKFNDWEVLNSYRLLCEGKCDFVMGIEELKRNNTNKERAKKNVNEIYDVLENNIVSKTDGWVSRWLEYYICTELEIEPFKKGSYDKLKKEINPTT